MTNIELNDQDLDAFVDTVSGEDFTVTFDAGTAERLGLPEKLGFCEYWPIAKAILTTLAAKIGFPGNVIVGTLIQFGDRKYEKDCQ